LDASGVIRRTSIFWSTGAVVAVAFTWRLTDARKADLIRRAVGARGASPASLGPVLQAQRSDGYTGETERELF